MVKLYHSKQGTGTVFSHLLTSQIYHLSFSQVIHYFITEEYIKECEFKNNISLLLNYISIVVQELQKNRMMEFCAASD